MKERPPNRKPTSKKGGASGKSNAKGPRLFDDTLKTPASAPAKSDRDPSSSADRNEAREASPTLPPFAARLGEKVRALARRGIYLGTSSWKYPGWLGQVYDPARYDTRGRFSQKRFDQECLSEYAEIFPAVGGDFSFYQFPSDDYWRRMFEQTPAGFRFGLKVPEEATIETFPKQARYGDRAGQDNPHFMDAGVLIDHFLGRLDAHREKVGTVMFEFGKVYRGPLSKTPEFVARLDAMLERLPHDRFRFSVEVRNANFLSDGDDYLACLRAHATAHVLNSWTHMPPVEDQLRVPGIFTAGHVAARFLLRPGRSYQQAVDAFEPYERMQDPYPEGRSALAELIERCLSEQRMLFAFVNNRFEGNAPETLELALSALPSS